MNIIKVLIYYVLLHLSFVLVHYGSGDIFLREVFFFDNQMTLLKISYNLIINYFLLSQFSFGSEEIMDMRSYILLRYTDNKNNFVNLFYRITLMLLMSFLVVESFLYVIFDLKMPIYIFVQSIGLVLMNFLFWMFIYLILRFRLYSRKHSFLIVFFFNSFMQYIMHYARSSIPIDIAVFIVQLVTVLVLYIVMRKKLFYTEVI